MLENFKKRLTHYLLYCIQLLTVVHAAAQSNTYRVYLIGDAGKIAPTAAQLEELLTRNHDANIPSAVVFLGDNIYERGMPPANNKERLQSEQIILAQLKLVQNLNAKIFFVPGNHDWRKGRKHGLDHVQYQQQFIDSLKNSNVHFFPRDGCPGPVEIPLDKNSTLVILDSQWFLHPWQKPEGDDSPCDCKTPGDVFVQLNDLLVQQHGKQVIVAAHHPIYTYGEHAGNFAWQKHIFPLRDLNPNLYLPLPILGSIYPLYRKYLGNIQDVSHPIARTYRESIQNTLKNFPGTIYVSGHEHALEYSMVENVHYVVSGSGSKNAFVQKRGHAQFVSGETGFVRIDIIDNNTSTISFFSINKSESVYTADLTREVANVTASPTAETEAETVTIKASNRYNANRFKAWLLGENYRAEWHQMLTVPVFNFKNIPVMPTQKGGGMQTLSLRLEDTDKNEFTFRSVEKFPEKAVPEVLRGTFGSDLVQDQISAAHPYGALVVPYLAEAAGIYHANPRLYFIGASPELGSYQKEFANTLVLFEERPSGNETKNSFFGNAEKIYSTDKVLEKLAEDNDNQVDQSFVVRSRLFDLVIGDWDRHDDQWRWSVQKQKKSEIYRPIPRDRDQAFFLSEGVLAKLWSRKWALPKFEGFNYEVRWTPGFMFNARYFDRSFLNHLQFDEWKKQADYIQKNLSDEAIESSIKQFPVEIYQLHGSEIIAKLKSRRDKLERYAREHYEFLAKEVDVPGSNKAEQFNIVVQQNGDVNLEVNKLNKRGAISEKLYDRFFRASETNEIRLFGLAGNDQFQLTGSGKRKIKIRIIGGADKDSIHNSSSSRPLLYDTPDGVAVQGKIRNRTSTVDDINSYDRKSFRYPRLAPLLYGNYNYDDGLFVGGGFHFTNYGFRKEPFKSRHIFLASYAPLTSSYDFRYWATYKNVVGKWGIDSRFNIKAPNFVNNFFGWGNETTFDSRLDENPSYNLDRAIDYYRLRLQEVNFNFMLTRSMGSTGEFFVGPSFQRVEIETPSDAQRFIYEYAQTLPEPILDRSKSFAGINGGLNIMHVDNRVLPNRGIAYQQRSALVKGIEKDANNFTYHEASLTLYQSFRIPSRVTYAIRIGGGINSGNFEIYQAQILDGKTELRGYRKTRFYGDQKLYFNSEIRIKLTTFRSYLFPATLGINGFYDVGRVWYKNESGLDPSATDGLSSVWHKGIGGGIWFTPFNVTVITSEFAHSKDGNMFYIRMGFLF